MTLQSSLNNKVTTEKQKVLKIGKVFLLTMLFFTFFSKTIINLTLPEVIVTSPFSGEISRQIRFSGEVIPKKINEVYAKSRFNVKEIMVKIGDEVKKDDLIIKLDDAPLKEELIDLKFLLDTYQNELKVMELELEALMKEDFFHLKHHLKTSELQLNGEENKYKNNKQLFDEGKLSSSQLEDSSRAYTLAQRDYELQREDLVRKEENLRREIEIKKLNIRNKELDIEKTSMKALKIEEEIAQCNIYAIEDGIIGDLNVSIGMEINNLRPIYRLHIIEDGYHIVGHTEKDYSTYLEVDDEVIVFIEGLERDVSNLNISKLLNTENNTQIFIDIDQGVGLEGKEKVEVSINKSQGYYQAIIPNHAIYKDFEGNHYVYIVEEKNGYLGKEFFVTKRNITIGDSNLINTGIKSGLMGNEKVIISSNKPLENEVRVRIR